MPCYSMLGLLVPVRQPKPEIERVGFDTGKEIEKRKENSWKGKENIISGRKERTEDLVKESKLENILKLSTRKGNRGEIGRGVKLEGDEVISNYRPSVSPKTPQKAHIREKITPSLKKCNK